jgi:SAM-dependent methyltransferase
MSEPTFSDHFSGHAAQYAQFRPVYPSALYAYLASICPRRTRAWDCATGSGQAAVALAGYFDQVIATDASAEQVAHAEVAANVEYRLAPAEVSGIEAGSVDLVTVAQALHWFDLQAFYAEVDRVLRPGGVLAVWCYELFQCSPDVDAWVEYLYSKLVGAYWPPERRFIEDGYRSLPFPYAEQDPPPFAMEARWDLARTIGYLRTWSAVQRYVEAQGQDPVAEIALQMGGAWGEAGQIRTIRWPLHLRVGRKPQ